MEITDWSSFTFTGVPPTTEAENTRSTAKCTPQRCVNIDILVHYRVPLNEEGKGTRSMAKCTLQRCVNILMYFIT